MINELYMSIVKEIPAIQDELQKYIIDMFVDNACVYNHSGICRCKDAKCHDCEKCNVRNTVKIALKRLASIDSK